MYCRRSTPNSWQKILFNAHKHINVFALLTDITNYDLLYSCATTKLRHHQPMMLILMMLFEDASASASGDLTMETIFSKVWSPRLQNSTSGPLLFAKGIPSNYFPFSTSQITTS
jgi:hypothetical protein